MHLHKHSSEIYIPDGLPWEQALARTTHMAIGAHQDDNEIMAIHGILQCFGRRDNHFTSVTVTDGAGSARSDLYANYTDQDMQRVRRLEQKKAAFVGEYTAQVFLDYTSGEVKDPRNVQVAQDLKTVIDAARPHVIYTHNLADKHDTHVSVALRTIHALRELPKEARPKCLYGCEVWRNLDWMNDEDKVVFDVQARENLAMALVGLYDSQICGGKRYDLATWGRRRANATYFASHDVDETNAIIYALNLAPLIEDEKLDPGEYIAGFINRFASDVSNRLAKLA
jgi:LmbE family N-acetylglucosaminyl deacetylase